MSRNSSGTYSLPSGNPVVSGTTISSTWANNTLSDVATALTDSLDRQGRGAMSAPLRAADGTAGAPSVTFDADQDTGLYRAGANDMRATVGGADAQQWDATGTTISVAITASAGATVTTAATNGTAINGTGTGSGAGVYGEGGSNGGKGVFGVGGASTGRGVEGHGTGVGVGVYGLGGETNAAGVMGVGRNAGVGGTFANGSPSDGSTLHNAVELTNGPLAFVGVTNPASTTAATNQLTPTNLVKAWAQLHFNGTSWAVKSGFNIASVATGASPNYEPTVTLATAMASTSFGVICSPGVPTNAAVASEILTASTIAFIMLSGQVEVAPSTGDEYNFLVLGAQ